MEFTTTPIAPSIQLTAAQISTWQKNHNGELKRADLVPMKRDATHSYYRCPCGGLDHYARQHSTVPEAVLHCFETGRFWTVDKSIGQHVVETITDEEKKFNELLNKWLPQLPKTMSTEQAFQFITAKGVPYDIVRELVDDGEALEARLQTHREKSGNKFRKEVFA